MKRSIRGAAFRHSTACVGLLVYMLLSLPVDASPLKVLVILDVASPINGSVLEILKGHTSDLNVSLSVDRVGGLTTDLRQLNGYFRETGNAQQAEIVFFPDFSDVDRVVLYVSMPKLGTTLIRNIDAVNETTASRLEITAVVVRGILTAMVSGGEIGVHVPSAKAASVENTGAGPADDRTIAPGSDAAPARSGWKSAANPIGKAVRFGLRASYGLGWVASDVGPVHHFQAGFGMSINSVGWYIAYRGTMPFGKEDRLLSLSLTPHVAAVGFWASFQRGDFIFRLGGAVLFDAMAVHAVPKTPGAGNWADSRDFRAAVQPFVAAEWHFVPEAFVSLSISSEFYVFQNVFYIEADQAKTEFLRLWPVSPVVQLGFGFGFPQ